MPHTVATTDGTAPREAVGVFKDPKKLESAIDELTRSGFDRAELSLLAGEDAVRAQLGHRYKSVKELEDDPTVPRTAYVCTEAIGGAEGAAIGSLLYIGAVTATAAVVASGGALAAAIAAAALGGGTGGALGAALAKIIGEHHAKYLQDQLEHGGLLLWVRTRDKAHEAQASKILAKHGGSDVHVHALAA